MLMVKVLVTVMCSVNVSVGEELEGDVRFRIRVKR